MALHATLRRNSLKSIALKHHRILFLLLLCGLLFRISGVFWGIPPFDAGFFHPDEPKLIVGAYNFPQDIAERTDLRYPTAYHYIIGLMTWPIKKMIQSVNLEMNAYITVYLLGRLLSVILGVASIALLYMFVESISDKRHAIVSSAVLCFSLYHVTNSAWATTDVATSFWFIAYLLFAVKAIKVDSTKFALASGVSLGFLVGTKYTGAIAVIPFLIALFLQHAKSEHEGILGLLRSIVSDQKLWIVGASSMFVFMLSTPGILLQTEAFLSSIVFEQDRMSRYKQSLLHISSWRTIYFSLVRAIGLPLTMAALIGLVLSIYRKKQFEIILATMVILYVLYFGNALFPRYWIMMSPLLAYFSSISLLVFVGHKNQFLHKLSVAVCLVVLLYACLLSGVAVLSRYPDTRSVATNFLNQNIAKNKSVGIAYTSEQYGWRTHAWRYPVVDDAKYRYVDFLNRPDVIIVSSYDRDPILKALKSPLICDRLIIPDDKVSDWYRESPPNKAILELFQELYMSDNKEYEMLHQVIPKRQLAPIEFGPPTIDIFAKRSVSAVFSD